MQYTVVIVFRPCVDGVQASVIKVDFDDEKEANRAFLSTLKQLASAVLYSHGVYKTKSYV